MTNAKMIWGIIVGSVIFILSIIMSCRLGIKIKQHKKLSLNDTIFYPMVIILTFALTLFIKLTYQNIGWSAIPQSGQDAIKIAALIMDDDIVELLTGNVSKETTCYVFLFVSYLSLVVTSALAFLSLTISLCFVTVLNAIRRVFRVKKRDITYVFGFNNDAKEFLREFSKDYIGKFYYKNIPDENKKKKVLFVINSGVLSKFEDIKFYLNQNKISFIKKPYSSKEEIAKTLKKLLKGKENRHIVTFFDDDEINYIFANEALKFISEYKQFAHYKIGNPIYSKAIDNNSNDTIIKNIQNTPYRIRVIPYNEYDELFKISINFDGIKNENICISYDMPKKGDVSKNEYTIITSLKNNTAIEITEENNKDEWNNWINNYVDDDNRLKPTDFFDNNENKECNLIIKNQTNYKTLIIIEPINLICSKHNNFIISSTPRQEKFLDTFISTFEENEKYDICKYNETENLISFKVKIKINTKKELNWKDSKELEQIIKNDFETENLVFERIYLRDKLPLKIEKDQSIINAIIWFKLKFDCNCLCINQSFPNFKKYSNYKDYLKNNNKNSNCKYDSKKEKVLIIDKSFRSFKAESFTYDLNFNFDADFVDDYWYPHRYNSKNNGYGLIRTFNKYDLLSSEFVRINNFAKYIEKEDFNKDLTLKDNVEINLYVVGIGKVGSALLRDTLITNQFVKKKIDGNKAILEPYRINVTIYDKNSKPDFSELTNGIYKYKRENYINIDNYLGLPKDYKYELKNESVNEKDFYNTMFDRILNTLNDKSNKDKKIYNFFIVSFDSDFDNYDATIKLRDNIGHIKNKNGVVNNYFVRIENDKYEIRNNIHIIGNNDKIFAYENVVANKAYNTAMKLHFMYSGNNNFGVDNKKSTDKKSSKQRTDLLLSHIEASWITLSTFKKYSNYYAVNSLPFKLELFNKSKLNGEKLKDTFIKEYKKYIRKNGDNNLITKIEYYNDLTYPERYEPLKNGIEIVGEETEANFDVADVYAFIEHERWVAYELSMGALPMTKNEATYLYEKNEKFKNKSSDELYHFAITNNEGLLNYYYFANDLELKNKIDISKLSNEEKDKLYSINKNSFDVVKYDYDTMNLICKYFENLTGDGINKSDDNINKFLNIEEKHTGNMSIDENK